MSLAEKLHPSRFTAMSGKMAAIVAYILGERWTNPGISQVILTSDNFILATSENPFNQDVFGHMDDLNRNWDNLLEAAQLSTEEKEEANSLFLSKIRRWNGSPVQ